MSQLYNAARDGTPVVLTAGHKDRAVLAEDGFCAVPDLAALLRPFTKMAWLSLAADAVPADLARAIDRAAAPPSGPTFLAVPEDLMREAAPADWTPAGLPGVVQTAPPAAPDPAWSAEVARCLMRAERPIAVIGTQAAGATGALQALAAAFELPVLAADLTDLGRLTFPADDPHALGVYGDEPALLEGCDLVVALGCRLFFPFAERLRPRLPLGASVVHIHPDPQVLGRNLQVAWAAAADVGAAAHELVAAAMAAGGLGAAVRAARAARLRRWRTARDDALGRELEACRARRPPAVAECAAALARVLPPGTIVADEGVRASRLLFRHGRVPREGAVWRSSGGALGWGVPCAIGAKLAQPDRPVVAVVGDGSLHFSVQALWTAVQQRAPLVVVVLDNGGYLAVKRAVEVHLGVPIDPRLHPGTEIPGLDHLAVATGYGARATRVTSADALAEAVEAGLRSEAVHVVVAEVERIRP